VDNNCDGAVDEGVTITYYLDADGDGYGVGDVTHDACALPDGYTDNDMDCDDSNVDVYPNAPEVCDGVDNQCPGDTGYGEIDENDVCVVSASIASLRFDDSSGDIAIDSTVNGNEATLVNGPVRTAEQVPLLQGNSFIRWLRMMDW
jgi:hypothetical protein